MQVPHQIERDIDFLTELRGKILMAREFGDFAMLGCAEQMIEARLKQLQSEYKAGEK
jgi:hypothetical protein